MFYMEWDSIFNRAKGILNLKNYVRIKTTWFLNWKNQTQNCIWRTFYFKESKLGQKVLLKNKNYTTLVQIPIFVKGNPQQGMGHKN
jgi:hypothetical protein